MFWAISSACARSSATSSTRWRSTWAGARPGVRRRRTGACIPAWQSQARWGDTGCLGAGCTQRQLLTALRRTQACAYISATSAGAGCLERRLRTGDPAAILPVLHYVLLRFSRHVALDVAASGYEAPQGGWTRARSARPQGGLSACQRRCSQRLGRCRLPGTPCHRPRARARTPARRLTGARPRAAARQDGRALPGCGAEAGAGPFPAQAGAHLRPVPGAGAPPARARSPRARDRRCGEQARKRSPERCAARLPQATLSGETYRGIARNGGPPS